MRAYKLFSGRFKPRLISLGLKALYTPDGKLSVPGNMATPFLHFGRKFWQENPKILPLLRRKGLKTSPKSFLRNCSRYLSISSIFTCGEKYKFCHTYGTETLFRYLKTPTSKKWVPLTAYNLRQKSREMDAVIAAQDLFKFPCPRIYWRKVMILGKHGPIIDVNTCIRHFRTIMLPTLLDSLKDYDGV